MILIADISCVFYITVQGQDIILQKGPFTKLCKNNGPHILQDKILGMRQQAMRIMYMYALTTTQNNKRVYVESNEGKGATDKHHWGIFAHRC